MRVAGKLTIALVLGILVVMATYAYLQIRHEVELSQDDLQRAQQLGLAWAGTMEAVLEREGLGRAKELMLRADARAQAVHLRFIALDPSIDTLPRAELSPRDLQALAAGDIVRMERLDQHGEERRYIYAALGAAAERKVGIELVEPVAGKQRYIQMSHLSIALATVGIVLVCGLIASLLHFWLVGRPIQLLRDKARRVGDGDFSGPLGLRQNDEIGELGREIDEMCDRIAQGRVQLSSETEARIAALEQLRHADRLATVGRLAAGVAHELGTPLNVISARAELITASERAEAAQNARVIIEQSERMAEIIRQLLDFSRRQATEPAVVDLRHVVARTVDLLSAAAAKARVELHFEAPGVELYVDADENQLHQVLTNIVLNGIQSMPDGGRLSLRLHAVDPVTPQDPGAKGSFVEIEIEDQGGGIAAEHLAHVFEPFFTTKQVGEGTGLGLAVAHGIVSEHGGWITVASEIGRGTRFSVFLPRHTASRQGVAA